MGMKLKMVMDGISEEGIVSDSILEESRNTVIHWVNFLQQAVHINAVEHGFWEKDRNEGECIALMHSELSEALEAIRKTQDHCVIESGNVAEELADCVIRIMDYCESKGINLGKAIVEKHEYNRTREYKHGKKF